VNDPKKLMTININFHISNCI